ncbi:DUF4160 domain-containing protein [Victivallis sp. Marseille-Q1083]|uniref:DUF4160 domain-containing protein n=1 Tax=Victivallis sp. Marseille-Q1083 TaxID=2717288 RepID=UPI00158B7CD0|nr:DUF4160 domain-containing protein [Victivallis sp. Marseille-Q1083]
MPVICRFYGILIKMYFRAGEHNPPHFHAIYGDRSGMFDLDTLDMIEGDLPQKALAMVQEWGKDHRAELLEIWNTQKFREIAPLE